MRVISEEKFCNVLTDIIQEISIHSDDSIQEIVNEKLEEWKIEGIKCNHSLIVET